LNTAKVSQAELRLPSQRTGSGNEQYAHDFIKSSQFSRGKRDPKQSFDAGEDEDSFNNEEDEDGTQNAAANSGPLQL
jgi:hypothetical protein